jgi:outer membrane protein OmpA-like peptidoglycan-associated protein
MTYNEALSSTTAATSTFAVVVAGSIRTVSSVAISGSTVRLTLSSAVLFGQSITVAYTDPSGSNDANAVQDSAGNDAATLSATSVTNNVGVITGLTPTFAVVISLNTGFTVTVSNYDPNYIWSVTVTTPATVTISSSGLITVTGLTGQGTQATVTVTTTRTGYTTQSASITGSTTPPPPPPNFLFTLTPPTFAKVSSTYVCNVGTYEFIRAAVTKEVPKISIFVFTLTIDGKRVSQVSFGSTSGNPYVAPSAMIYTAIASKTQAIFELGARTDILPAQCEVLAYQENAVGMGNSNILAKGIPNVSWPALLPITATSKIGSSQLNATADVAGTFVYSVAAGSTLEVGKYTLTLTFTPKDIDNYDVVVVKNQLRVLTASTSIRNSITIQAPQQTIAIRTSAGILKADPEMLLGGKATAGSSGFGIEKISISGSSVTVWPMPGFSGKTSLGLIQSGAGGIINIVQPLIVVPIGVSLVNVNVLDFAKPTLTWSAVQGAASYLVSANGERVCSTAVNTCIGQIPLGPKSLVSVTVTGKDLVKTTTQPRIVVKADVEAASVNFDSGEFVLTADARAEILRFARAIRPLGYTKLTVTGHTDTDQGVDNNKLSQDRATAVLGVLQKLLPGYSISIKGQADSEPVASNNNEVGKAKNRRVEIRVVQG